MTEKNQGSSLQRRIFRIEASRCFVKADDPVTPDTEIGEDFDTGEIIRADCYGKVVSVAFSGGEHSMVVTILSES